MRNQTSFRLTTTLLPTDTTAKTTTVINKVDSNGDKFYPTFTEETVVITNDDRTVMETTRATCTDGVLTFTARGLSDDASATPVENRKLTWNPGSLCFITAGAGDWIDKDDDITWTGKQTYTDDFTSQGKATYNGRLITKKGVEYPHFDSLEDLQAYTDPFGGMFAVVDSDGELYRYNAVNEVRDVVTTSTPAQPAQASTTAIGTVRGATDAEFAAGTATGSNSELLVATPAQIQGVIPMLTYTEIGIETDSVSSAGDTKTASYTVTKSGIIVVQWGQHWTTASIAGHDSCNDCLVSGTSNPYQITRSEPKAEGQTNGEILIHRDLYFVTPGVFTVTAKALFNMPSTTWDGGKVEIRGFISI